MVQKYVDIEVHMLPETSGQLIFCHYVNMKLNNKKSMSRSSLQQGISLLDTMQSLHSSLIEANDRSVCIHCLIKQSMTGKVTLSKYMQINTENTNSDKV